MEGTDFEAWNNEIWMLLGMRPRRKEGRVRRWREGECKKGTKEETDFGRIGGEKTKVK